MMAARIGHWFQSDRITDEEFRRQRERILRDVPAPVFWLLGKTGSGKTSVVHFLTGAERAEIGNGYRPQTASSQQFDFPAGDNPLIRFLDTRGLGESRYDPAEDISAFEDLAHVVVVTVRVMDHALLDMMTPLRKVRQANPDRPVVLALTCLHEGYPQQQHPDPDPFELSLVPDRLPEGLRHSMNLQLQRFDGLVDRIVPIDLTRVEEGFAEPNFGGPRLKSALLDVLPEAHRQTLLSLDEAMRTLKDLNERRALPYVMGYSTMAATAGAVPVPWLDIPFVAAIQSHLVYQLASVYGQSLDARACLNMVGPIGARLLTRLALKSLTKFIPLVGAAANAAMAYVCTYALGKVCCWYFGQVRQGNAPTAREVEQVWRDQLQRAAALWKKQHPAEAEL